MRLTRSMSLRMRLKKKKNKSLFWGLASFRRNRQKFKSRVKRQRQVRVTAEYVTLASHRHPDENIKLVA
ncbi:hypothetical protein ACQKP8_06850 [Photobacterium alginatilyticum]|uniref:Uncharacterized protein n=1 Tax=Photobacterium alginatilyticum TaxID=1775171 RepID=A0ABW9YAU0_9GAMM|nr:MULTISPECIES: hypothetical protein [Photobacterium]MCG7588494.1 hypothetical protein [Photobacterium sp. OFAV2-7]NBI50982.1 hypothetical protein [Photobacterium alginatilyticum]